MTADLPDPYPYRVLRRARVINGVTGELVYEVDPEADFFREVIAAADEHDAPEVP